METAVVMKSDDENLPEKYNHAENVAAIKQDIDYIRNKNAEYAVRIGKRLILAKENVPHGKWLETLEELDFTHRTAVRLMKIAETFGDNIEIIENMSQRRAYILTALPEENIIQLKHDGLVTLPDGTTFTLAEYHDMAGKEFENNLLNLRNQKNAEIRDWRDRAVTAEQEMKEMRNESDEREDFLKKFMADKHAAAAEKIEKLNRLLADVEAEKNKLKVELMDKDAERFAEEECLEAIAKAKVAVNDVYFMVQNVKPGYNRKLRAELVGYTHWLGEHVNLFDMRLQNFIDRELDDDDREDKSA